MPSKPLVKTLSVYTSSLTDVPTFGAYGATRCDLSGNLYFHLGSEPYSPGVIMRLEHGDLRPQLYKLPTEMGKEMAFSEFGVSPRGKVRLLEQAKDLHYAVFTLDSDTSEPDRTNLHIPAHLVITDFVASDNGALLLAGYHDEDAEQDTRGKSFLALLDASGRIQKDLTVEGPGSVDLGSVREKLHDGAATVGPDGNFYFVSGSSLLVLSAYGDVVKRMPFDKPEKDLAADSVTVAGDLVSIQFSKVDSKGVLEREFLVLTASTGDPYGLYVPSKELGNHCLCFSTRSGYTFLRVENGKLKLVTAALS